MNNSSRPAGRRRGNQGELRAELRERREDAVEGCKHHATQLERMERVALWLARQSEREGSSYIHRTWGQIAAAIGHDVRGMTVEQVHAHHRTNLRNTLRYLEQAGAVDSWQEQRNAQGEGTGILIELAPGASQWILRAARGCSSVGSSVTRRPRCSSDARGSSCVSAPDFRPSPEGVGGAGTSSLSLSSKAERAYAHARGGVAAPETRATALRRSSVVAALGDVLVPPATERRSGAFVAARSPAALARMAAAAPRQADPPRGSDLVSARPELALLPPSLLLREARRTALRGIARPDLRLGAKAERRLESAVAILARYGYDGLTGPAAAAAAILDIASGRLDEGWRIRTRHPKTGALDESRPKSIGGLAFCLRRYARAHRRRLRTEAMVGG